MKKGNYIELLFTLYSLLFTLLALQKLLNKEDNYVCIYANFEVGQAARNDKEDGVKSIIRELYNRFFKIIPNKDLKKKFENLYNSRGSTGSILNDFLSFMAELAQKPVILLIDEIDSLVGDTLISVLRQIRAGYDKRPENFPSTILLCGVRDIKDYRIQTSGQDIITGGSAFNIKTKSLRLGNFTKEDNYQTLKAVALKQTADYADKCSATESHILIFDRAGKTNWQKKVFTDSEIFNDTKIKIWGM